MKKEIGFWDTPRDRRRDIYRPDKTTAESLFYCDKLLLTFTVKHFYQSIGPDVSQFILRKNKMVAGIDIAVPLHDSGMAAMRATMYIHLASRPPNWPM